jgi:hypothetical protein
MRIQVIVGAVLAVGALSAACNAILGNDALPLLDGSVGGGDASDADHLTQGDSGGETDGGHADADASRGCTPDAGMCGDGGAVIECSSAGQWVPGVQCPFVCSGGQCAGTCVPGTKQCSANVPQTCDSAGRWQSGAACSNVCSNGACALSCAPGAQQCSGNTPQTCDAAGQWQDGTMCPFVCSQGKCIGSCVPNTTETCGGAPTCNAGASHICDATGTWGPCTPGATPCVSVPAGWQPVATTTTATCPSGFGTPQAYVTGFTGGGPYVCSCACAGTQACSGTLTLNHYAGGCGGSATPDTLSVTPNCGAGSPLNPSIISGDGYAITNVSYGPSPACTATPTPTNAPAVFSQNETVCAATLTCPSGACLSSAQSGAMCISQVGANACPPGFATRTLVAQKIGDTRNCGACTCSSTLTCNLTGLLADNDSACGTGTPYSTTVTTSCAAATGGTNYPLNATKGLTTSSGTGACAPATPSSPVGSVSLDAATTLTVCCP